jgi:Arylsulfatase A and related enzymes
VKILAIFADMVGAEHSNSGNTDAPENELDILFRTLGGTFYSRCFTPAPDTPRSTACMWSGIYSKGNGCNNRLKYPRFFLDTEYELWHILEKEGYNLNVYMRNADSEIGMLPEGFQKYIKGGIIDDYLDDLIIDDRSFTFFYLHDLHSYLDNYGYTPRQFKKGIKIIAGLIKKIFRKFDADMFDYILIFSDHGFRYEGVRQQHLIDEDRVKTIMFMRKKGESNLEINKELRSNLDVFPTILDMIGVEVHKTIEGKTLLGKGHDYVLIEDHDDFSVRLSQSIEHWAVFTPDNKYWLECSGEWDMFRKDEEFDRLGFERIIKEKMNDYSVNRKLWDALHTYDGNKTKDRTYSDGSSIKRPFYRSKSVMGVMIIIKKTLQFFQKN